MFCLIFLYKILVKVTHNGNYFEKKHHLISFTCISLSHSCPLLLCTFSLIVCLPWQPVAVTARVTEASEVEWKPWEPQYLPKGKEKLATVHTYPIALVMSLEQRKMMFITTFQCVCVAVGKLRKEGREGAPVTWIKLLDYSHSFFSESPSEKEKKNLKVG